MITRTLLALSAVALAAIPSAAEARHFYGYGYGPRYGYLPRVHYGPRYGYAHRYAPYRYGHRALRRYY